MEFSITDPNVPRLPPVETRILDMRSEPYLDGQRLRAESELTPFEQYPNLELTLSDSSGNEVASASFVELVDCKFELKLHVRQILSSAENFTLATRLYYPEMEAGDQRELNFDVPSTHPQYD